MVERIAMARQPGKNSTSANLIIIVGVFMCLPRVADGCGGKTEWRCGFDYEWPQTAPGG